jgi:hypothetical protein
MIKKILLLIMTLTPSIIAAQLKQQFDQNISPEWHEIIAMYGELEAQYEEAQMMEFGTADIGLPMHLFVISKDQLFTPEEARKANKQMIFINNGIHPGECNGMDAALYYARELLENPGKHKKFLEENILLIVPVFNIGGALNRSPWNRANQNGPVEHGFRGNARNLDLNRDFVKLDTKNGMAMARLLQYWDPHIFLDTHSTNGADYPYTVTLIPSHHQQLEKPQSEFMKNKMLPWIYTEMNKTPYLTCPYVNIWSRNPLNGLEGFYENPRYLCGYTSFFHMLSFTVETHMLKPYEERVMSSVTFFEKVMQFATKHKEEIMQNKEESIELTRQRTKMPLQMTLDTSRFDMITFTGYTAKSKRSEVTGQERMYYDVNEPWTKKIPFFDYFKVVEEITIPEYYIIPSAWHEVIHRLELNAVEMAQLKNDTVLEVEAYFIEDFESTDQPYNGHYYHYNTQLRSEGLNLTFRKGDYVIPTRQRGLAYIAHVLEPQGPDSYFAWNFFDAVLSRNEYFSAYLFEETAEKLLKEDPELRKGLEKMRSADEEFANNGYEQLRWIYGNSKYSETSYRRYPVYRYSSK